MVLLYSIGWLSTHYVDQFELHFVAILLPKPSKFLALWVCVVTLYLFLEIVSH